MFFDPVDHLQGDLKAAKTPVEAARLEREARQRAGLCESMVAVAAKRGFGATTIHEVVTAAGFGKLTYYKLYGTVEACFVEAVEACGRVISEQLEERLAGVDGARPRAETGLQALVDLLAEEPDLARVLEVEARAGGMASREAQLRWLDRLAELFAKAAPGADEWPGRMAFGAVTTLVALEVAAGRTTELPTLRDELIEVALAPCEV